MKRPSLPTVLSVTALFFSLTGVGLAADHYLITSTSQIKPTVLAELHGKNGKNGKDGKDGRDGKNGATGATGAAGSNGAIGPAGTPGSNGASGPRGFTGRDGATGLTGPTGPTGATGAGTATTFGEIAADGTFVWSNPLSPPAVVNTVGTGVYCFSPAPGTGFADFVVATPVAGDSVNTTIQVADTAGDTCGEAFDTTLEVETFDSGVPADEAFDCFFPDVTP